MKQCLPENSGDKEAQMFFSASVTALNMDPGLSPQAQMFQRKRDRASYWRFRKLNNIHQKMERIAWHHGDIFVTAVCLLLSGEMLKWGDFETFLK